MTMLSKFEVGKYEHKITILMIYLSLVLNSIIRIHDCYFFKEYMIAICFHRVIDNKMCLFCYQHPLMICLHFFSIYGVLLSLKNTILCWIYVYY